MNGQSLVSGPGWCIFAVWVKNINYRFVETWCLFSFILLTKSIDWIIVLRKISISFFKTIFGYEMNGQSIVSGPGRCIFAVWVRNINYHFMENWSPFSFIFLTKYIDWIIVLTKMYPFHSLKPFLGMK